MNGYFANAAQILIVFGFGAVMAVLILRLLAEVSRVNFYNPISQFLYRATHLILNPVRRFAPSYRQVNLAPLILAYLVALFKLLLLFSLRGFIPHFTGLFLASLAELVDFILMLYMALIFAWALMSLFTVDSSNPIVPFIEQLTVPVVRPLQKVLPSFAGLDFSPAIAILIILLARVLLIQPLFELGLRLAQ